MPDDRTPVASVARAGSGGSGIRRAAALAVDLAAHVGRFALLCRDVGRALGDWRTYAPLAATQMYEIGVRSLPIVLLISAFAGVVTALQTGHQFTGTVPWSIVGSIVSTSVILELGPVLTGLILAGRVGARIAAELGTMRVTEQIDALETLARDPVSYLLVPRILAGAVMVPALVVFADAMGFFSGMLAAVATLPMTTQEFLEGARLYNQPFDFVYSEVKAFAFGLALTAIPCYIGFTAEGGAEGVGRATTQAVVASSVVILLLNTVLARMLL
jgi:phospholipid/cholesterol/gamma-HCH transport system permease protein